MDAGTDFIFNDRPMPGPFLDNGQAHVEVISDGNRTIKPGMKSVFIDDDDNVIIEGGTTVYGTVCSCNTVTICTCNMVCTCESVCSCVGHTACACDMVCTCESVCSCVSHVTCNCVAHRPGGGTYCSCVPVH